MKALIAWLRARHCSYADLRSLILSDRGLGLDRQRDEWLCSPQLTKKTKTALAAFSPDSQGKEILQLARDHETRLVLMGDADYPDFFMEVDQAPPILYLRGRGQFPPDPGIAVVGSRHTTNYGIRSAKRIAGTLASEGIAVISGFAEGIDTAAHRAALEKGQTIAVLGSGMDWIYPKSNADLYGEIAASGILMTEFPFGEKPYGYHFPFRNRLISALSQGIVLIEGTYKSGAMTTIRHGLEQGKPIYALPGDIDRRNSQGPNQLIFDGAEPLLDPGQIIDRFRKSREERQHALPNLSPNEALVLTILTREACGLERICHLSNLPIHDIVSVLTSLEIKDLIEKQGNLYDRSRREKDGKITGDC